MPAWEAIGLIAAQPLRRRGVGRVAARGPRPTSWACSESALRRGSPASGSAAHGHAGRRGRRGQVAPAARVRAPRAEHRARRHAAHRPLPALRLGHRLLGARRGRARRGRTSWTPTARTRPGRSSARYVRDVLAEDERRRSAAPRRSGARWASRCRRSCAPPASGDPERMREAFFSALRTVIEASAARRPLVLAFEDIHWADDGMLDAIEHLAQWVRAPLLLLCLARDELLERRAGWGGGRRNATQLFLDPLTADDSRELVAALLGRATAPRGELVPQVAERSGGNPLFAEEMVRRLRGGGTDGIAELPDTVQAVLAARLDALDPFERRLVQQAARGGAHLLGGLARAAGRGGGPRPRRGAERRCRRRTSWRRGRRVAPGGRARAGVQARADPRRGLRDAAQGGPLPQALRGRALHRGARRRPHRRGGGAAGRALRPRRGAGRRGRRRGAASWTQITERAVRFLEEAGDAAALLYANPEADRPLPPRAGAAGRPTTTPRPPGSARSRATWRCGWGAWTPRSRCGASAWTTTAARRTSTAWPTCTASSARRWP